MNLLAGGKTCYRKNWTIQRKYYSILKDEATDFEMKGERTNSSNLRFVDKNNIIRVKFANFLEYKNNLTGAGL